jgi:NAD(P)-dependent dehydrogenase (short-subunit alcohol dehydrogenase family)
MRLLNRGAIVTGASTGLGYSIARALLAEGANVAICARDAAALEEARNSLTEFIGDKQRIIASPCDVSCERQVTEFIQLSIEKLGQVEILVNNAGVLGPIGKIEDVDPAEWRRTIDTNLFGVFLFCRGLISHMRPHGYGKIINLSGGGATSPRPFFTAYAAAKAAVVRFTENLSEELRDTGIHVNSLAPGALNTRMLEVTLAAGSERTGEKEFNQAMRQKASGGSSFEKAAALCVYLSSPESDGITGKLISAPWDPWSTLHERVETLKNADIYTLRRIVPEDRGERWS